MMATDQCYMKEESAAALERRVATATTAARCAGRGVSSDSRRTLVTLNKNFKEEKPKQGADNSERFGSICFPLFFLNQSEAF